jgi:hypothetical protein
MVKKDPGRVLYYEIHGSEHWAVCFWCKQSVFMSNLLKPGESRKRDAGCVHHIDHDHDHNVIENLTGMHYGCHTAYHKRLYNPGAVKKGMKLPKSWKEKVTASNKRKPLDPAFGQKISDTKKKRIREDLNFQAQLWCVKCRRGPFSYPFGMRFHASKGGRCDSFYHRDPATRDTWYVCDCGRKFASQTWLTRHRRHQACNLQDTL